MKSSAIFTVVSFALAASAASAVDPPGYFEFTAPGGVIPQTGTSTEGISTFTLTMGDGGPAVITDLELVLTGLTHTNPWDLDIYLIDPFGARLEIMTDRGDQAAVTSIDLVFNDSASALPPENSLIPNTGSYLPEDSDGVGGFDIFTTSGTDAWILLVIDDSDGNSGSLDSFTLRGVPEPVTLSLLAVGAITAFWRRRR